MASPMTALTELSEYVYDLVKLSAQHERESPQLGQGFAPITTIFGGIQRLAPTEYSNSPQYRNAVETLSIEPDLGPLLPVPDEPDPMFTHIGGGFRQPFQLMIGSLLMSAGQRMYYLRLEETRTAFVRAVLENYEELLRAARGEQIRVYSIVGYTGILLTEGENVQTPWGTIRPAPPKLSFGFGLSPTTAVLTSPRLMSVQVNREANPPIPQPDPLWVAQVEQTRQVLPLAFAFSTLDSALCAPVVTFETLLLPLTASVSYSMPGIPGVLPPQRQASPSQQELAQAEDWSRRLERDHSDSLQVAERRLVSAISQRVDKADSLIDAVIAWESMVGTRSESVFRITAALAILLASRAEERPGLRRKLQKLYDIRSRVVHGDLVDQSEVISASEQAIDTGLRTLRALYSRGGDWLTTKSSERADRLILENIN
jgi:Apea-like HEPN